MLRQLSPHLTLFFFILLQLARCALPPSNLDRVHVVGITSSSFVANFQPCAAGSCEYRVYWMHARSSSDKFDSVSEVEAGTPCGSSFSPLGNATTTPCVVADADSLFWVNLVAEPSSPKRPSPVAYQKSWVRTCPRQGDCPGLSGAADTFPGVGPGGGGGGGGGGKLVHSQGVKIGIFVGGGVAVVAMAAAGIFAAIKYQKRHEKKAEKQRMLAGLNVVTE
jgi:hypothetical protein